MDEIKSKLQNLSFFVLATAIVSSCVPDRKVNSVRKVCGVVVELLVANIDTLTDLHCEVLEKVLVGLVGGELGAPSLVLLRRRALLEQRGQVLLF